MRRAERLKTVARVLSCRSIRELAARLGVSRAVLYSSTRRPFRLNPALLRAGINPGFLQGDSMLFESVSGGLELTGRRLSRGDALTWHELYFLLSQAERNLTMRRGIPPHQQVVRLFQEVAEHACSILSAGDHGVFHSDDHACGIYARVILHALERIIDGNPGGVEVREPFTKLLPWVFYFALGGSGERPVPSCLLPSSLILAPPEGVSESGFELKDLKLSSCSLEVIRKDSLFYVRIENDAFRLFVEFSVLAGILCTEPLVLRDDGVEVRLVMDTEELRRVIEERFTGILWYYLNRFGCY